MEKKSRSHQRSLERKEEKKRAKEKMKLERGSKLAREESKERR